MGGRTDLVAIFFIQMFEKLRSSALTLISYMWHMWSLNTRALTLNLMAVTHVESAATVYRPGGRAALILYPTNKCGVS